MDTDKKEISFKNHSGGYFYNLKKKLTYDDPILMTELQPAIEQQLTRKSEIWGFFFLAFGYFSWANITGSIFQPLLVQQIAKDASHLRSNPSIHCPIHSENIPPGDKCVSRFGFIQVDPTSYALLINVVTVWCTIAVSLGTSALADHGRSSKKFLITFCLLLSITTSFVFIGPLKPEVWWVTGLLVVIGNIFSGVGMNFFDAHIPILSRHHPSVVQQMVTYGENSKEYVTAKVNFSTFLSGGASAAGYAGGILLLLLGALILNFTGTTTLSLSYCFILTGGFLILCLCVYGHLSYQRTMPPLPEGYNKYTYGYVRIAKTLRQARSLKTMLIYLFSWFILGDGLTSATNMAILIAKDTLNATNTSLIIAALLQNITAGSSMAFWIWLQNKKGFKPKNVIAINSTLFSLIIVYVLLGNIKSNPVGLKHMWELYMMAGLFGLFLGAIHSANRVVFSIFIPLGHENELYALFEMAGVSSSWIGPLVCAAIIDQAGVRQTWWFLLTQFVIPPIMLYFVDVDVGRKEAKEFSRREKEANEKLNDQSEMDAIAATVISENDLEKSF